MNCRHLLFCLQLFFLVWSCRMVLIDMHSTLPLFLPLPLRAASQRARGIVVGARNHRLAALCRPCTHASMRMTSTRTASATVAAERVRIQSKIVAIDEIRPYVAPELRDCTNDNIPICGYRLLSGVICAAPTACLRRECR